jgi:16S rRNA (cytosine967-C5)-methyltransferase
MPDDSSLAAELRDASRIVAGVAAGSSLDAELQRQLARAGSASRQALLDLTHGTLRRFGRGRWLVRQLSKRGRPDSAIEALLDCALYALESGRHAPHTVVDQAVKASRLIHKPHAGGYVNGLLRGFIRDRAQLEKRIDADAEARYQHPAWWIEALRAAYPRDWVRILEAGNSHPPMGLRVNRRRSSVADYAARLESEGIAAAIVGPSAIVLAKPRPVERLPGFAEGVVSVQDAGAQRAAELLDAADGQRVLDACAAPGGKAGHLLERNDVLLTALDVDPARCARIGENLGRLGLSAAVRVADCAESGSWWDGVPYDRVIADVPCSGSGVVRRHPDIKLLRREADLRQFARRAGVMLDALWRVLAPGGKLLYVTCSVFPEENGAVVDAFCARTPAMRMLPLPDASPAQTLPGPASDGFFFALLERRP